MAGTTPHQITELSYEVGGSRATQRAERAIEQGAIARAAQDQLRASVIARRRTEEERAEAYFLGERRRRRRILDVRAADLQEEMAEQRFSVPSAPTKTAAT
jgi:hypothetical protein